MSAHKIGNQQWRRIHARALNVPTAIIEDSEPGDGTRYEALAFRVQGPISCGRLGRVTNGWVVVSGMSGQAYLFQDGDLVADYYVAEKLGLKNPHTIARVTEQVARLINGRALVKGEEVPA